MATNVNREGFLGILESVQPGLSVKQEVVEQSNAFIFKDGHVRK